MAPLVADPARPWKKAAFSQYPRGKAMGYSIRCGTWRYVEWIDRRTGSIVGRELYDHSANAVATRNVSDEPELADTVSELSKMLGGGQGWRAIRENLTP
jgi:hypothetical protein